MDLDLSRRHRQPTSATREKSWFRHDFDSLPPWCRRPGHGGL